MTRRPAASPVEDQPSGTADGAQPTAEPAKRAAGRHALADRNQVAGQVNGRAGTRAESIAVADQPVPSTNLPAPAGPNGAAPADLDGRSPAATAPTPPFRTRPPAGATGRRRHSATAGPSMLNRAVRWVILLAVTAAAVFGLRQYVIASYYIPSASMETTLHGCPGCQPDMVLVDKLSYRFKSISRSDVVVFARPPQAPPEDKQLIKRVIGLPGDVVSGHDGHVFVDNKELVEPYVDPACHGTADFAPVRVPTGRYFVMGDNRCDSFDSRMFGTIPRSAMIGRAFAVIWPVHHLRWL